MDSNAITVTMQTDWAPILKITAAVIASFSCPRLSIKPHVRMAKRSKFTIDRILRLIAIIVFLKYPVLSNLNANIQKTNKSVIKEMKRWMNQNVATALNSPVVSSASPWNG